jgi:hypothetical protein
MYQWSPTCLYTSILLSSCNFIYRRSVHACTDMYHTNTHVIQAFHIHTMTQQVTDTVRETGKKWVPGICMLIDNKGLDELASKLVSGQALDNPAALTAVKVMQKVL